MAATCAGCEQPIERGQKFSVIETEVFHRACVRVASQSILTRTKIALLRAKQAVNDQAHADALRVRIRELEDEVEKWKRDRNHQYGVAEQANQQLSMVRVQLSRAASDTMVERARATEAERALELQRSEIAELRSEIRAMRDAQKPPEIVTKKSEQDATSIRYSLLELDLDK